MFVCKYVWLSMKKFILKGINIETMHLRMVHYYVHMCISGIELSRRRFTYSGAYTYVKAIICSIAVCQS